MLTTTDELLRRIKTLNETLWEGQANKVRVDEWLSHFDAPDTAETDKLHALYLLSCFSYFSQVLVRELLRAMYRDLIRYPLIAEIRKKNGHTTDVDLIEREFVSVLNSTRFLGMGDAADSGAHLIYLFRQANDLPKKLFMTSHELGDALPDGVERIIVMDDFAGSGQQATRYSQDIFGRLNANESKVTVQYLMLFATTKALKTIRKKTDFDSVDRVCELDETFRAVSALSRYFPAKFSDVSLEQARTTAGRYGKELGSKSSALGFRKGQLLLGFAHNIPNNTLPIFSQLGNRKRSWSPLFRRFNKK